MELENGLICGYMLPSLLWKSVQISQEIFEGVNILYILNATHVTP